ncbi:MAG: hypothetical protein EZS28_011362 [Streblomastix strix]|uniref:Uncharacterized protein n=1 Tax=Streblomastix strix TaxID=222440 RepID=A0A5J4WEJ9_9EUKA|nr:MAG: hypothetical protein EZS28_011362 [Streblomastix strix]
MKVKAKARESLDKQKKEKVMQINENLIELKAQIMMKDQSGVIHKYVEVWMEQSMNVNEMIQLEKKKDHEGMNNYTTKSIISCQSY